MLKEFIVGEKYSNDEIRLTLGVENLGGIRPSIDNHKNLRHVAIFTTAQTYTKKIIENPYQDKIENNTLTYTAQGRTGDQFLSGRNKRIIEQYERPIPLYCFSNQGNQVYIFLGLLELLRHYQEHQIDKKKEPRVAWVFEFHIHDEIPVVPIDTAHQLAATFFEESRKLSTDEREIVKLDDNKPDSSANKFTHIEVIRSRLLRVNPYRFEHLVKDVIERYGFVNVSVTSASQDGGIDLNAYVSELDFFFSKTHVQLQVKRWRHSVGSVEINLFRGALNTTAKGIFITTSYFTKSAVREANHESKPCVTLIDGTLFSKLVQNISIDISQYE